MSNDKIDAYTVFGYIRQLDKVLKSSDCALFQNIPESIILTCIEYYQIGDYFEFAGDCVEISDDKTTIVKLNDASWSNSSYGTYISSIGNSICKWDIKIHKAKPYQVNGSYLALGISSIGNSICKWDIKIHKAKPYQVNGSYLALGISSGMSLDTSFIRIKSKGYHYGYGGWQGVTLKTSHCWGKEYGEPYGTNDVVSIELNLKNRTVTFYKNQQNQGVAYTDVRIDHSIGYRLAVSMYAKGTSVEILKFRETFRINKNK
eukprot:347442_1